MNANHDLLSVCEALLLVGEHKDIQQGMSIEQLFPKRFEAAREAINRAKSEQRKCRDERILNEMYWAVQCAIYARQNPEWNRDNINELIHFIRVNTNFQKDVDFIVEMVLEEIAFINTPRLPAPDWNDGPMVVIDRGDV